MDEKEKEMKIWEMRVYVCFIYQRLLIFKEIVDLCWKSPEVRKEIKNKQALRKVVRAALLRLRRQKVVEYDGDERAWALQGYGHRVIWATLRTLGMFHLVELRRKDLEQRERFSRRVDIDIDVKPFAVGD